jgi:hypothetical protein
MEKSKAMCSGCSNNFYNHNTEKGCWMFEDAKVVERMRVGVWQSPPYVWNPQSCLSCFSPDGFRMIGKDDPRIIDLNTTEARTTIP